MHSLLFLYQQQLFNLPIVLAWSNPHCNGALLLIRTSTNLCKSVLTLYSWLLLCFKVWAEYNWNAPTSTVLYSGLAQNQLHSITNIATYILLTLMSRPLMNIHNIMYVRMYTRTHSQHHNRSGCGPQHIAIMMQSHSCTVDTCTNTAYMH